MLFFRDLKSGNVLVTGTVRCKIADFGTIRQTLAGRSSGETRVSSSSRLESESDETKFGQAAVAGLTSNVGTPMYMSPEMLKMEPYGP